MLSQVDGLPTFEFYPLQHGAWRSGPAEQALRGWLEEGLLPVVRALYGDAIMPCHALLRRSARAGVVLSAV